MRRRNQSGNAEEIDQTAPSAPPLGHMDFVAGYDNVKFDNFLFPPPPAYGDVIRPPSVNSDMHPTVPAVTEEEARDALIKYVSTKWCYSSKAARELVFTNITPSTALHYQLETFTEGRQASWTYEPYNGLSVDSPANGPAPQPWDVVVNPPEMFKDGNYCTIVPHTASVKTCYSCSGRCAKNCVKCRRKGHIRCTNCRTGYHGRRGRKMQCIVCFGTNRISCYACNGAGLSPCEICCGMGKLKWYIKLEVTWKNNNAHHVIEKTTLPDHLIKNVSGRIVFEAEHLQVAPLVTFFEGGINTASQRLVKQHANQFAGQKILQQRHFVKMVPVSEVAYTYNNDSYTFWVYGDENEVYEDDYPLRRCCGLCTIS
ncbi:protein SSUH2 homolog isoform X2 [Dysidea avara]|uniref:protein SSUH2 homolog isoform X2 n=1 Tax=Dysidea avara TaxID=196820 RepID=UPI003330F40E